MLNREIYFPLLLDQADGRPASLVSDRENRSVEVSAHNAEVMMNFTRAAFWPYLRMSPQMLDPRMSDFALAFDHFNLLRRGVNAVRGNPFVEFSMHVWETILLSSQLNDADAEKLLRTDPLIDILPIRRRLVASVAAYCREAYRQSEGLDDQRWMKRAGTVIDMSVLEIDEPRFPVEIDSSRNAHWLQLLLEKDFDPMAERNDVVSVSGERALGMIARRKKYSSFLNDGLLDIQYISPLSDLFEKIFYRSKEGRHVHPEDICKHFDSYNIPLRQQDAARFMNFAVGNYSIFAPGSIVPAYDLPWKHN